MYAARYGEPADDDKAAEIFSYIVSAFPLGGLVGSFGSGWMASGLGRYSSPVRLPRRPPRGGGNGKETVEVGAKGAEIRTPVFTPSPTYPPS